MTSLEGKIKGVGILMVSIPAKIQFEIVCAECYQPLTITTILQFADCPQVSVMPCACQAKGKAASIIVEDMKSFVEYLDKDL